MKTCSKCGETKSLDQFKPGRVCFTCANARQRAYRLKTGNSETRKYEKTKSGFIMRAYRNMESRVKGIQWRKAHLYAGKPLLPREQFYEWAITSGEFHELFAAWELAGYARQYTPSVDRIDSRRGYELDNMRWVSFTENCRHIMRKKAA